MPKATIELKSGAVVSIDGTTEEIKELLAVYGTSKEEIPSGPKKFSEPSLSTPKKSIAKPAQSSDGVDLLAIVNHAKTCDEAERIGTAILDHSGLLPRILLPLFIINEYMNASVGLTSGEISKITSELAVPIAVANVSKTVARASQYVMGDKVRKNGQPVRYKISRKGVAFIKELLTPAAN